MEGRRTWFRAAMGLLVALSPIWYVAAGTIEDQTTCTTDYIWMYNSLEQTSCYIAAFLLAACTDGSEYV